MNYTLVNALCHDLHNQLSRESSKLLAPLACLVTPSLLGCLVKCAFFMDIYATEIYNKNLKVLLCWMTFSSFCTSIMELIQSFVGSILLWLDPCQTILDFDICRLITCCYTFFLMNSVFVLIGLSVERLVASVSYAKPCRDTAVKGIATVAIMCLAMASFQVIAFVRPHSVDAAICIGPLAASAKSSSAVFSQVFACLLIFVAVLMILWAMLKDRKMLNSMTWINTAQHSLATRYQISVNLDINNSILPMSVMILLRALIFVLIFLIEALLSENQDVVHPIYCILQIISELWQIVEFLVFFKANRLLKGKTVSFLRKAFTVVSNQVYSANQMQPMEPNYEIVTKKYFEDLECAWS
uniref:Gustatory receptor n=1 Tax=Romanomermis culicivorax TaxID=13658 RepID=A0A915K9T4_ROMCU